MNPSSRRRPRAAADPTRATGAEGSMRMVPIAAAIQFARIPSGRFLMGSETGQGDERPVHQVEVSAFECAVYPVTQAQYADFLHATDHERPREWPDRITVADLPVTGVSWIDA